MPVWIGHLGHDLRHALRMIAKTPVAALVVIVSLGIGIGVNTVVFSWIDARLLHPIAGVSDGASVDLIEPRSDAGVYVGTSWLDYRDLRERLRSFRDILAFRIVPLYVGETGRVERAFGLLVSDNYFSALGLRPALGRYFTPAEVARPGAEPVAVISYGLWQSRYGGDAGALGRTLRVNGRPLTIVGVTPREFQGTVMGLDFAVWLPATLSPAVITGSRDLDDRGARGFSLLARRQPSVTRAHAQSEVDAAMRALAAAWPATNQSLAAEVLPYWQAPRGPQRLLTTALAILQGIMLLLLAAVCGNTANLVLARASARQKEMGVRLALGAGPGRIASLLLTETVVLALIGSTLGVLIAVWGTQALMVLPLSGLPLRFQTNVSAWSLVFAAGLGLLCGAVVGGAPALHLARVEPQLAFRSGSNAAGRSGLRNALMGIQVALAVIVLVVAALFVRSFVETRTIDPGFRREGVLLAAYDLTGRNADQAFARAFPARLLERLRATPTVAAAAIASSVPLDIHGLPSRVFTVEGHVRTDGDLARALANTVTPGYFEVMRIPLLSGRDFANLDDRAAPPQAIVNDAFARRYLPKMDPIGRRLQARGRTFVIVGVARTSTYDAFGEPPTPIIYFSYRDSALASGEIHLRTRGGTEGALAAEVRAAVRAIDPEVPVFNVRTLDAHVETNLIFRRIPARMFAVLGPLLLGLAAIGIYAVVAYTVSLRTTEIGVRQALGATARRVIGQVVEENLRIIVTGLLIGWTTAVAVAVVVADARIEPSVFGGVPLVLLLVGTVACWLPASRAARADPMMALRRE